MTAAQLDEGLWLNGALKVQMKLSFRQGTD